MINRSIKIILIAFVCSVSFLAKSYGEDELQAAHIRVAMRTIGDQVLLKSGDTTSRVLPVQQEGDRYRIRFESEFQFDPDEMITIVEQVVNDAGIAKDYLVEVEDCRSGMVVYGYEMGPLKPNDLIACRTRAQPKGCYSILFTVLEAPELATADEGNATSKYVWGAVLAILLLSGGFVAYKKNKNKATPTVNPNIISMGSYLFDKRNMTLLFEQEVVELTSKEADLLLLLHTSANDTLERDEILKSVWGSKGDYVGRTLDVFISKLRKKLEGDASLKIVNVRGVGYKLVVNE